MKITIVSNYVNSVTVPQLEECIKSKGIDVAVKPITFMELQSGNISDMIGDCVIWRYTSIGAIGFGALYGVMNDKIGINSGLYVMPEITNKYFQQQLIANSSLSKYAIPTLIAKNIDQLRELIRDGLISYPLVVKPIGGTLGKGVIKLSNDNDVTASIKDWSDLIIQPYIKSDAEWRVFVIGGTPFGAMKKTPKTDSDFLIGTKGVHYSSEDDQSVIDILYDIACKITSLFHLEFNGIDIVRDIHGNYYVYEVNTSAGWENDYQKITGEDIPSETVDWLTERYDTKHGARLEDSLQKYLDHRLRCLSRAKRQSVENILQYTDDYNENIESVEARIRDDYYDVKLEEKLRFVYFANRQGYDTNLKAIILSEAQKSVSWAGNFLVDMNDKTDTGLSTAHTLENGCIASAYYIAIMRRSR